MTGPTRGSSAAPATGDASADRLRRAFRQGNKGMVEMFRLGLGPVINVWPQVSGRILVLGHTGRRTGLRRWTPLNYAAVDGAFYCVAGFGSGSDWFRNITATPTVELWLPAQRLEAIAEDVSDHPDRLRLVREVLVASGFAAWVAGMRPRTMSEADLVEQTSTYRLIRLVPKPTGSGLPAHPRPGDHAAMMVIPAVGTALWALRRARGSGCSKTPVAHRPTVFTSRSGATVPASSD